MQTKRLLNLNGMMRLPDTTDLVKNELKQNMSTEPANQIGIYPGTFDPVTLGHMDIISRAQKVVDKLIIAIADNDGKGPLFPMAERKALLEAEIEPLHGNGHAPIEVVSFETLLVDFAVEQGASVIIRGLRAVSDFEYEFQMASMNRRMRPDVETVFLMASETHQFISSRFVKEIARLGGDISHFASPNVVSHLKNYFENEQRQKTA